MQLLRVAFLMQNIKNSLFLCLTSRQIKMKNVNTKEKIGGIKMEKKQKINCTVESCKFNDNEHKECDLEAIIVTPIENCDTKNPDESQCSSYKYVGK